MKEEGERLEKEKRDWKTGGGRVSREDETEEEEEERLEEEGRESEYGVATIRRLIKIIGLICKTAL